MKKYDLDFIAQLRQNISRDTGNKFGFVIHRDAESRLIAELEHNEYQVNPNGNIRAKTGRLVGTIDNTKLHPIVTIYPDETDALKVVQPYKKQKYIYNNKDVPEEDKRSEFRKLEKKVRKLELHPDTDHPNSRISDYIREDGKWVVAESAHIAMLEFYKDYPAGGE